MTNSSPGPVNVQVTAFGRLHLGLVNLSAAGGRVNGGAGIMIRQSSIRVKLELANRSLVTSEELKPEVELLAQRLGVPAYVTATVEADRMMRWHYGMGYHTQLRLALATALAAIYQLKAGPRRLTEVVLRGGTSSIGVHGFWRGGVLFDGGRRRTGRFEVLQPSSANAAPVPAPLLFSRTDLPFTLVVAQARGWALVHGEQERELFARLTPIPQAEADQAARLVFQDLTSAIATADFDGFCSAIEEIQTCGFKNRERHFRGAAAIDACSALESVGLRGVGMSSWGPTWFGFAPDRESASRSLLKLSESSLFEFACIAEAAPSAQVRLDSQPAIDVIAAMGDEIEPTRAGDA